MRARCICCGLLCGLNPVNVTSGPIHFDCYLEHHCGPDVPWPPDHHCGVDAGDEDEDEQSYACAYPDHTPLAAYEYMLSVLTSTGLRPEGNES